MKTLDVSIEIEGRQREAGVISGNSGYDAAFRYSEDYLGSGLARPLSVSLPLAAEAYGPEDTRSFFEGLLPEGFMRRTVAEQNRTDSSDYLTMLEILGCECLGAIQIRGEDYRFIEPEYREIDPDTMYRLAEEGAARSADMVVEAHLSLTGATGKIGAYKDSSGKWFLPVGSAPSTHILKQSHIRYNHIVQNEQLAMRTAGMLGIAIPDSEIVRAGEVLFASRRYDRSFEGADRYIDGLLCPLRLHQEDMGQALGIPASDKYERPGEGHMRRMFDLIKRYSASPIEDQIMLWRIIVFNWLIGNTDGHIKNFSLIYDRSLKSLRLAPAYDIVSTVVYDTHSTKMAFSIGGEIEWEKIDRSGFESACAEAGLNKKLFIEEFDRMNEAFASALSESAEALQEEGFCEARAIADKIKEKRGI